MPAADLLVLASLAVVFGVSGVAKLRSPRETEDAFVSLRIPSLLPRKPAAAALPRVELLLAVGLVVAPGPALAAVAAVATSLLAAYTALIARALGFDEPVTCACFGRLGGHRVDRLTLVRNVLLTGLAGWAVVIGARGGSLPGAVDSLDAHGWAAVVAAVIVATIGTLIAAGGRAEEGYADGELDYLRAPIPFARLERVDGTTQTLRELAATQARLLLFLSPHCGSCQRLAANLDGWAARLAPMVDVVTVYASSPDPAVPLGHDADLVAIDSEDGVRAVFGIHGTPAAVLLGADGLLAGGPVAGTGPVTRLVEDALAELEVS